MTAVESLHTIDSAGAGAGRTLCGDSRASATANFHAGSIHPLGCHDYWGGAGLGAARLCRQQQRNKP
jgi:hypothetical protein